MLFFGWGRKTRDFAPNDTTRLVVAYSFFHIWWAFTVAWSPKYFVAVPTEQGWGWAETTKEHATMLNGGITPDISAWWKFSLAGLAALGVFVAVVSAIFASLT